MPTIRNVNALAAGAQITNVLQGSQFEFLGAPARVQVYAIQDSGGAAGIGEVEVFFGQELQLSQSRVNVDAKGPVVPDDLVVDDFGAGGDRIVVRITETGGANGATLNTLVKITPIPM
jgi:hypothetical protein